MTHRPAPLLGTVIRAARLQYHLLPNHAGFMRLSVQGDHALFELRPLDDMPNRAAAGQYVEWWEDEDARLARVVRHIALVERPFSFSLPLTTPLS